MTKPDRLRAREIEVERILIREPRGGRIRLILETGPPRPGMEKPDLPSARLTLLDRLGNVRIVAEVDACGDATLFIGGPDQGTTVVVTPSAVDAWAAGSVRAALRTEGARGVIEVDDVRGRQVRRSR